MESHWLHDVLWRHGGKLLYVPGVIRNLVDVFIVEWWFGNVHVFNRIQIYYGTELVINLRGYAYISLSYYQRAEKYCFKKVLK